MRYQKGLPPAELIHFDIGQMPNFPRQNTKKNPHSCGVYIGIVGFFISQGQGCGITMDEPMSTYRNFVCETIFKGSAQYCVANRKSVMHDHCY